MSIYILDTETTGIGKSDQVIELAYYECGYLHDEVRNQLLYSYKDILGLHNAVYSERYLPSCPINPHAYAVHGISRTDLSGKPLSTRVDVPEDIAYIVGHNIAFDKRMLEQSNRSLTAKLQNIKYICTLELARLISKHYGIIYENHKLDTLVKHYYPNHVEHLISNKHNAKGDVVKTLLVLLKLVKHIPNIDTWNDLYELQEKIKNIK